MSFRSLLLTLSISAALIPNSLVGHAFAQDVQKPPEVANSKYQIDGVVNVDSVYVRSGPGEAYYPTQELTRNTPVTVVGIRYDWLKILPPEGSFSYVAPRFVDRVGNSSVGKINQNDVNIRCGSTLNAQKTTVQTRLNIGDTVEVLGQEQEYLKIKPPAGAYLYIKKDYVTIARPPVAANTANPQPNPGNGDQANSQPPTQPIAQSNPNSPSNQSAAPSSGSGNSSTIMTAAPTTAPSNIAAAPTTNPSLASAATTQPAVAAAPPPSPEELFSQYESKFTDASKQPLDAQPLDELIADYQGIAGSDQLSDELKSVVNIRIATLKARQDNKVKLVEVQRLQKLAAARQLALQAEQQELAERLKANEIQVFVAVGQLQPSSLQVGGGTLYRLVDPSTGRTEIYVRTSDPKITNLMGEFVGINGESTTDPQLSLRVINPTDAKPVEESKVNASVMASIVPPSLLARQAAAN
jgi:hypothetical protein